MIEAILLICGIIAFFAFPGFRKLVIVLVVVTVIAIFIYIANKNEETEASKRRVSLSQLDFIGMGLAPEAYGSDYILSGRIRNNSGYSISEVKAKISVLDCDEKEHCEVVGEEEEDIAPLIPPGQVRDVNTTIYFTSSTKVRGHFQWKYAITEIQARR